VKCSPWQIAKTHAAFCDKRVMGMGEAAACGTCEDFDTLETLLRRAPIGPQRPLTEAQILRARVLVERLRLDHQRAHAVLGAEPDPFPPSHEANVTEAAGAALEAEGVAVDARRLCECGHAFPEHAHSEGRPPTCRLCFVCRGYVWSGALAPSG